jgi:predicted nucleotidyltransferase
MKTVEDIERTLRERKSELREKYGVTEIGVFGSYVRSQQREDSDVHILVSLERPVSLRTFAGMGNHLEEPSRHRGRFGVEEDSQTIYRSSYPGGSPVCLTRGS